LSVACDNIRQCIANYFQTEERGFHASLFFLISFGRGRLSLIPATVITAITGILVAALGWLIKDKLNSIVKRLDELAVGIQKQGEDLVEFKLEVAKSGMDVLRTEVRNVQDEFSRLDESDTRQWEIINHMAKQRRKTDSH
jgi:hypothetical protein